MKSSRLKKDKKYNLFRDVRNLFRLKKEIDDITFKDTRNLSRLKKENEAIKYRIIRVIRKMFEYEEEDFYQPVTVGNFGVLESLDHTEFESKSDKSKTLSVEEYV